MLVTVQPRIPRVQIIIEFAVIAKPPKGGAWKKQQMSSLLAQLFQGGIAAMACSMGPKAEIFGQLVGASGKIAPRAPKALQNFQRLADSEVLTLNLS